MISYNFFPFPRVLLSTHVSASCIAYPVAHQQWQYLLMIA